MHVQHRGARPRVHPTAYVAPGVTLSGDVTVGAESRILYGAVLTAEGGPVSVGERCVVMEQAVLRGTPNHPLRLGSRVLVGPRTYLSGCLVDSEVFLATGTTVFNGAHIESGVEVRINGVVHLKSRVPAGVTVPIGWVAVGDPASILPPDAHDEIWRIQEQLDFPGEIFGVERSEHMMREIMDRYTKGLARHLDDVVVER